MMSELEMFSRTRCRVGESPVRDAEGGRLLRTDIDAGRTHVRSLGTTRSAPGRRSPASTAPRAPGPIAGRSSAAAWTCRARPSGGSRRVRVAHRAVREASIRLERDEGRAA